MALHKKLMPGRTFCPKSRTFNVEGGEWVCLKIFGVPHDICFSIWKIVLLGSNMSGSNLNMLGVFVAPFFWMNKMIKSCLLKNWEPQMRRIYLPTWKVKKWPHEQGEMDVGKYSLHVGLVLFNLCSECSDSHFVESFLVIITPHPSSSTIRNP